MIEGAYAVELATSSPSVDPPTKLRVLSCCRGMIEGDVVVAVEVDGDGGLFVRGRRPERLNMDATPEALQSSYCGLVRAHESIIDC